MPTEARANSNPFTQGTGTLLDVLAGEGLMSYVPAMCTAGVALTLTAAAAVGGSWVRQSLADDPPAQIHQSAPEAEPGTRYELPEEASSTIPVRIGREARLSDSPPGPSTARPARLSQPPARP